MEPIIRKKLVRKNKILKLIQKESKKKYGKVRGSQVKGKVFKLVRLEQPMEFLDLTEPEKTKMNYQYFRSEEILERIQKSNLTGLSGNGFSTYEKIRTVYKSRSKSKVLIINAVECDPGLLHDEWLLHNKKREVHMGIELLSSCIPFQKVILASKEAIPSSEITCYQVPNRYPMGAEKLLIQQVLGQELASEEIPADKGILVLNVQTVLAIGEIVMEQKSFQSRYLTVADLTTGEAKVVKAYLGSNAKQVLERVFRKQERKVAYYGGGAMMAEPLTETSVITKKTNFIGYSYGNVFDDFAKCVKCGECTKHCPMNLDVRKMIQLMENGKYTEVMAYHPDQCIQCGTCSYYCRAGKNVMGMIADLRENVR